MLNDVVNNQQQAPFCHMNVHKFHFINGSNPVPLLFIFVLFSTQLQMLCNIYCKWKKYWWCAWDLNPGQENGRLRRVHWAMAAPLPSPFVPAQVQALDCLLKRDLLKQGSLNGDCHGQKEYSRSKRFPYKRSNFIHDQNAIGLILSKFTIVNNVKIKTLQ